MEVRLQSLQDLFGSQRTYLVPVFQRRYVWTAEEQWESFWEDVKKSAETCLAQPGDSGGPVTQSHQADHFVGAVVIQQKSSQAEIELRNLIDGQQRLVTLQLLLKGVEDVFEGYGYAAGKRIGSLVRNAEEWIGDDEDASLKVRPSASDLDDFRWAMQNPAPAKIDKRRDPLILQARLFFAGAARKWVDQDTGGLSDRVRALERAVRNHVKMVVIELADTDDEHLIFETLNARGTPLTDWDLTKNLILNTAGEQGLDVDRLQQDYLKEFDDSYWPEDVRAGGVPRSRVDILLNYWMVMRTTKPIETKPRATFRAIERYVKGSNEHIDVTAQDLSWVSSIFRELDELDDRSTAYGRFLHRWRAMQARVLTPVLLRVLTEEPPLPVLERSVQHLESYLVRRMVCQLTTRNYYGLSLGLLQQLESNPALPDDQIIFAHLKDQQTDGYRWPSDDDLRAAFFESRMYGGVPKTRLRIVLEGIEGELRTPLSDAGPIVGGLSIEHFMPQAWRDHWDPPQHADSAGGEDEDPALRRDRLIHTMGNLTLVTKRLNSSMTNAGLDGKRAALEAHSTLFLNKDLLSHSKGGWGEAAIAERARRLCDAAIRVWPGPDSA